MELTESQQKLIDLLKEEGQVPVRVRGPAPKAHPRSAKALEEKGLVRQINTDADEPRAVVPAD